MYKGDDRLTTDEQVAALKMRIKELESELGRKPKRFAYPTEIVEPCVNLHGLLFEDRGDSRVPRFLADGNEGQALGRVVRRVLFGSKVEDTEAWRKQRVPNIDSVTEDEYRHYIETMGDVLKALDKGRAKIQGGQGITSTQKRRTTWTN